MGVSSDREVESEDMPVTERGSQGSRRCSATASLVPRYWTSSSMVSSGAGDRQKSGWWATMVVVRMRDGE